MKGFIIMCMFMAILTLYLEIGNQIHGLQYGYTAYQVENLGCPDNPNARWCPIYNLFVLPVTIGILGVMLLFLYVFVTDILLTRRQRIENQ